MIATSVAELVDCYIALYHGHAAGEARPAA